MPLMVQADSRIQAVCWRHLGHCAIPWVVQATLNVMLWLFSARLAHETHAAHPANMPATQWLQMCAATPQGLHQALAHLTNALSAVDSLHDTAASTALCSSRNPD